jgi:Zn finger protein HypA/HybF involved in hydrogenase expression
VRAPEIAFRCPSCGGEATAGLDGQGRCAACGATPDLALSPALRATRIVEECPACQGKSFYVQRDFNQKVGLGIVVVGGSWRPSRRSTRA